MLDILLRQGFTVAEELIFQEKIFISGVEAQFAAGLRAEVVNGDVFESSDDYEPHFQRLEEHLIQRTNERRKAARPTSDDDHERHQKQWLSEAYDPLAKELGEFIQRSDSGNLMRRAEVPHIQRHAVERVMRLSRNEMLRLC